MNNNSSVYPQAGEDIAGVLSRAFLAQYPAEAARELEKMAAEVAVDVLKVQPLPVMRAVWCQLMPVFAERLIPLLNDSMLQPLLTALDTGRCANLLARLEETQRIRCLEVLDTDIASELQELLTYPENTAGRLMDTRVPAFHHKVDVAEVVPQLKSYPADLLHRIYVLDDEQQLLGYIDLARLIQADETQKLESLMRPVIALVTILDPKESVIEQLQAYNAKSLPVLDAHGCLAGLIYVDRFLESLQEEVTADLQMMVGAGKEERALSSSLFAVRKRQGWLQINLLTGFLAAAVVGLFESTIAQFTALAVLMPVAAGQSGNTGAQALAVTMRGLTLREITVRQWYKVMLKEAGAGFVNGLAIALTCGIGVYVWSSSIGLALVIALAMIISMTIAGVSGALVPLVLKKLGQDPAQSSSIILTTITDIAGFMSFLGIATALSGLLVAG